MGLSVPFVPLVSSRRRRREGVVEFVIMRTSPAAAQAVHGQVGCDSWCQPPCMLRMPTCHQCGLRLLEKQLRGGRGLHSCIVCEAQVAVLWHVARCVVVHDVRIDCAAGVAVARSCEHNSGRSCCCNCKGAAGAKQTRRRYPLTDVKFGR